MPRPLTSVVTPTVFAHVFAQELSQALAAPLPGQEAQYRMAPRPRTGAERWDPPRGDARLGGVMALFYPHHGELYLPLILRATYEGAHSGQVSFPGGGMEKMDAHVTATALREAYEEVGAPPDQVRVLGRLTTLYVVPSNYVVVPVVGWIDHRPAFRTDPYEVARLLEVPLALLLDPANRREDEWQLRNRRALVPYFSLDGQTVWGATAMILSELLAVVAGLPCVKE